MADRLVRLEKAFRENPDMPLFARLADLYLRRGRVLNALSLCEKGCERFPWYPTGYLILSQCYEARGALEAARRAMGKALLLDPENPVGFKRLSRIYQNLGKPDLALKSLKRAARLDPLDPELGERVDQLNYILRRGSVVEVQETYDVLPQEVVETTSEEEGLLESVVAAPAEPVEGPHQAGIAESPSAPEPVAVLPDGPLARRIPSATEIEPTEEAPQARATEKEEGTGAPTADAPATQVTVRVTEEVLPAAASLPATTEALEIASLAEEVFGGPGPATPDLAAAPVAEDQEESSPSCTEPVVKPMSAPEAVAGAREETIGEVAQSTDVAEVAECGEVALPSSTSAAISDLAGAMPAAVQPEEAIGPDVPFAPRRPDSAEPPVGGVAPRDEEELVRLLHEIEEQEPPAPVEAVEVTPQPEPVAPEEPAIEEAPIGVTIATVTLAEIYLSQGLAQRAMQTYRQILAHDPGNETARKRLADLEHGGRNRS
jgi:Tfp pilus assembly protein PilF